MRFCSILSYKLVWNKSNCFGNLNDFRRFLWRKNLGKSSLSTVNFVQSDGSVYNDSSIPNVSECFQHTILVWTPALFFWILFPILCLHIARIRQKNYRPLPWSILFFVKTVSLLQLIDKLLGSNHSKSRILDIFLC